MHFELTISADAVVVVVIVMSIGTFLIHGISLVWMWTNGIRFRNQKLMRGDFHLENNGRFIL